ncbi:MAG: insulinase family protein [Muribaculaceae bacterium]|nr:insulinase family protein [Muribaculaceae bacterium]
MRERPTTTLTLGNGIRFAAIQAPGAVEYFGITMSAGSRDEAPGLHGLAHFVEHTVFKGTSHRRACHINGRMEAVGGDLNAFTTKEETAIYTVFPRGNLSRAVELVADLATNSLFPEHELEKEREVVSDEIDSYLDTPAEAVFDDFEDRFFRGSQLGHNILGPASNLRRFTSDVCRGWLAECYTAPRTVAFYLGPANPAKVAALVERHFSSYPAEGAPLVRTAPAKQPVFHELQETDSHQSHTVVGAAIPSVYSGDRYAIGLVSNILGGPGMNSRLNVALRERRGLVYSVEASANLMTDCGLFTVYYGCDPADNERCRELVIGELERIASEPMTPRALRAARKQYLGQLQVSGDSSEQNILSAARSMLYFGSVATQAQSEARIEAVTADDILRVASCLTDPSTLTLGPR